MNIFDELFERGMFVELTVFSAMKLLVLDIVPSASSTKNSPNTNNIATINIEKRRRGERNRNRKRDRGEREIVVLMLI